MFVKQNINSDSISFQKSGNYLERPRLQRLLKEAMDYPVVAVYAGAGYGKTHTVYTFLQEYDAHTIWIQVSERDNVGSRFWENYTHMVSVVWPEAETRLAEIGFPETDEAFAKFSAMVREATAKSKRQVVVYDDFHLLHNPAVLRVIERTVNILPSSTTVMLLSRTMPEINLISMMLRERIFTIHEETLQFTEEEISEYFTQLSLSVTGQNIREICDNTKGWAFAINLIGLSLQQAGKYEGYAMKAMKTNIFKLIETEIFQAISEPLRRFLLCISLIDHLAVGLIKKLAKDDALIREMERLNAYIRYDFHLDAYMIHHLFLDYLRQKQHILTEEEKRETYQEAGIWCEKNKYQTDALSYYEKSKDYNAIIRIVYSFSVQIPQDVAKHTLEIFDRISEEVEFKYPLFPAMNLRLKICLGLLDESVALAERYVKEFETHPESSEKNRALSGIYGTWGVLRVLKSPYTDVYDFDVCFEKQRMYFDKAPYKASGPLTNQPIGAWASLVGTNRAGAQEEYIEALSRSIPNVSHVLNGNWYGFDDLAQGELHFYRREINDAEQRLKQALNKGRERNQYDIQNRALFFLMLIAFIRGNLTTAEKKLKEMEALLSEEDYVIRHTTYDIACGFYYLWLYQPEQVPEWLKEDFSPYTCPIFLENYANRAKAQYHYQMRQYSTLLAYIENEREQQTVLYGKISARVLEALSLYQLKRRDEAIIALTEAYELAEPNNIVVTFIQHGKDMRTLTAAALKLESCPIPKLWLEDINRKSSAYAKRRARMMSEYKSAHNLNEEIPLTRRETEVLKDLAQGLSRTEIAASQDISANTVKMVINIIYDKLCISNLADAIRIAVDRKIV